MISAGAGDGAHDALREELSHKHSVLASQCSDLRSRIATAAMSAMNLAPAPPSAPADDAAVAAAVPSAAPAQPQHSASDAFVQRMEITQELLAAGFKPAAAGGNLEAEVETRLKQVQDQAAQAAAEKARQDRVASEQADNTASFGALGGDMFGNYMK